MASQKFPRRLRWSERMYLWLMDRARARKKPSTSERSGYDRHHVTPKFFRRAAGYREDLVWLTLREHFLAHWLLTRCFPKGTLAHRKAQHALMRMSHRKGVRLSAWGFEVAKRASHEANKAVWNDPKCREKKSAATKEQWKDPKYFEKMAALRKDPKYLEQMRANGKAQWNDPINREKLSAAIKSKWKDPVYREKLSAAMKSKWKDPVYRAALKGKSGAPLGKKKTPEHIAAMREGWARRRELLKRRAMENAGAL